VKSVLKKTGIAAAVALVTVIAVGAYLWHQATALPDWYTQADPATLEEYTAEDAAEAPPPQWIALPEPTAETPVESVEAVDETASKPSDDDADSPRHARRRKSASRHELRGFHRRGKKGSGRSAIRASRAVYESGRLEAGVVFDLSRIPKDKLVQRDRELYDRAVDQFPGITRRDVYIGIEDRPVNRDGMLQLGPSPRVRVGNLRYSLDKAARKIGMTPAQLRDEFDRELHRLGFIDPAARR
jgi:hypothetical protein